jgi:hypothetical protein
MATAFTMAPGYFRLSLVFPHYKARVINHIAARQEKLEFLRTSC